MLNNHYVVLSLFFWSSWNLLGQTQPYFNKYKPLADSLSKVYHVPSCVILSVAYIESGGGTSSVAKNLHNHFGIVGNCQYNVSHYQSRYRYYPSIEDSFVGFCILVASKKFYPSMLNSTDAKLWLRKIAATGYAADANSWTEKVYGILVKYCR